MSILFAQMMPGMEYIPLMLFCIAAGLLSGILGTLVGLAVSQSPFSFWAGVVACVFGVCSPLFFLVVVGRHLVPGAYPILAIPLLAGVPAILLSRRPSLRWLGETESRSEGAIPVEPERRMPPSWVVNRTLRITLVLVCAALALVACCVSWLRPRQNFERLLAGDSQIEVRSVLITGQGKSILLSDPASARYLTDVFRSARRKPPSLGTTYNAEVRLSSGGSVDVGLYVPEEGDWMAMSWPLDRLDDPTYYWLRLPEPIPATIFEALHQLR